MSRRLPVLILFALLAFVAACTNKKVNNPIAAVDSKQPDKVLFDRAMDALKHNRFEVARITLQTLINTYPDSEFLARAKLSVADSWYAEGGSASLAQAEIEYRDFGTFFPNMAEAAEAQLKIANIHYQQMEKPDRDYTHALRAEQEYRTLIMQYPESKLLPEGKQRLREVQEVIAEREFRIGRFYFLRQSYPAAIARLRSLVDRYPLYSKADEVLYLLGQAFDSEAAMVRARANCDARGLPAGCIPEAAKARAIDEFNKGAAEAYSRILTRYPVMNRAADAKLRLAALHQPIPKPTRAALAQNKAEEDSRRDAGMVSKLWRNFNKHPDVAQAPKIGEPTLVDPKPLSASDVVQAASRAMIGAPPADSHSLSIEAAGNGAPPPNQPAPRSDTPALVTDPNIQPPVQPDPNELKPNVTGSGPGGATPDPNELKPNVPADGTPPSPPMQQVNEIQQGQSGQNNVASSTTQSGNAAPNNQQEDDDVTISSSKHKKKKGLHKVVPF